MSKFSSSSNFQLRPSHVSKVIAHVVCLHLAISVGFPVSLRFFGVFPCSVNEQRPDDLLLIAIAAGCLRLTAFREAKNDDQKPIKSMER